MREKILELSHNLRYLYHHILLNIRHIRSLKISKATKFLLCKQQPTWMLHEDYLLLSVGLLPHKNLKLMLVRCIRGYSLTVGTSGGADAAFTPTVMASTPSSTSKGITER